ncbi:hypothetical protein PIB30_073787 [Stylosanthes scabra]|uniref:Uncharacterized protein n=1 Tax=Stylosanthes scabra TaxID=79078 RepID=A0ABU6ZN59_9FABA|nr:hypothetical protein [Stylosanthes scabra]
MAESGSRRRLRHWWRWQCGDLSETALRSVSHWHGTDPFKYATRPSLLFPTQTYTCFSNYTLHPRNHPRRNPNANAPFNSSSSQFSHNLTQDPITIAGYPQPRSAVLPPSPVAELRLVSSFSHRHRQLPPVRIAELPPVTVVEPPPSTVAELPLVSASHRLASASHRRRVLPQFRLPPSPSCFRLRPTPRCFRLRPSLRCFRLPPLPSFRL